MAEWGRSRDKVRLNSVDLGIIPTELPKQNKKRFKTVSIEMVRMAKSLGPSGLIILVYLFTGYYT